MERVTLEEVKLTGLSLSFCIRDILRGAIAEKDVSIIYCGFDNWIGRPVDHYYDLYFKEWPKETVDALFDRLTIKPALCEHRNVSQGHWMVGEATEKRLADEDDRLHTQSAIELLQRARSK